MSQVKGLVTRVTDQKSGSNAKGPWTVQHIAVQDGLGGVSDVSVWNRPDLSGLRGQTVTIDGVTNNAKGEPQLRGGEGNIDVSGPALTGATTPNDFVRQGGSIPVPSPKSTGKFTLVHYLSIQNEVMGEVVRQFRVHAGIANDLGAVGSLVEQVMFAVREGKIDIAQFGGSNDSPL